MGNRYKHFPRLRTALSLILALGALCPAAARAEDVFTVAGVKVDVTAQNAVAAREKAFNAAETTAYKALAVKLLGDDAVTTQKIPEPDVINTLVRDFEVTNESLSAVRYIGTYTFRFDGPSIRRRMNVSAASYTDAANARPLLVLPFLQADGKTLLWGEANPWLKAWAHNDQKGGLVTLTVPLGDVRDVGDITDDQALSFSTGGMADILTRYNAGEAVILVASQDDTPPGGLSVMVYRTDHGAPQYVQTVRVAADPGASPDALYDKAVRAVRAMLQKNWKKRASAPVPDQSAPDAGETGAPSPAASPLPPAVTSSVHYNSSAHVTVHIAYMTMQEWTQARMALHRVIGITDMKTRSVTPHDAVIDLQFDGDETQLRAALARNGLALGDNIGGVHELTQSAKTGAASAGSGSGYTYGTGSAISGGYGQ